MGPADDPLTGPPFVITLERTGGHRDRAPEGDDEMTAETTATKTARVTIPEDTRTSAGVRAAGTYTVEMPADYDPALVTAEDIDSDPLVGIVEGQAADGATVRNYRAEGPSDDVLGTVDADTYARYLAEIGDDDVGAVDGGPYGFEGYTVYMQD